MAIKLKDLRVLIVDDMPEAIKLLKMVLGAAGVTQVFSAKDGRAAQEFLDSADDMIDLIICDWEMPRMTGLELLQQVRTVYPDMPFMMVTGNTEIDAVKAAKGFGVNAYLGKPFSPQQIKEKIEQLAGKIDSAA